MLFKECPILPIACGLHCPFASSVAQSLVVWLGLTKMFIGNQYINLVNVGRYGKRKRGTLELTSFLNSISDEKKGLVATMSAFSAPDSENTFCSTAARWAPSASLLL